VHTGQYLSQKLASQLNFFANLRTSLILNFENNYSTIYFKILLIQYLDG